MRQLTSEEISNAKEAFEANYDNKSILSSVQHKCMRIIDFMGVENAKKLSQDQLKNMIMATR